MAVRGTSQADLDAQARAAEREYQQAQEDRRTAEQNLDYMYRQANRYAEKPLQGKLGFIRLMGGVAAYQLIINKHTQTLAQTEMRHSQAELKLEAACRERDEAREADREADREDRAQLRREMEDHHVGRDPFRDRDSGRDAGTDHRDQDRERGR